MKTAQLSLLKSFSLRFPDQKSLSLRGSRPKRSRLKYLNDTAPRCCLSTMMIYRSCNHVNNEHDLLVATGSLAGIVQSIFVTRGHTVTIFGLGDCDRTNENLSSSNMYARKHRVCTRKHASYCSLSYLFRAFLRVTFQESSREPYRSSMA